MNHVDASIRPNRSPLVAADAIEPHTADLSVTIGADVTLGQLQSELARHSQWLPIDGADSLAVGRAVAFNSTGPLRLGYGAWRDLLLGVQFINGRGELISAGGRTVKNVAGYDLTKLMVGQGGDLGRIVTLTTRTYRRPTHALLVRFDTGQNIIDLLPTPLRPQWALRTHAALDCGYLGDERTIAFIEQELAKIEPLHIERRTVQQDMADRAVRWFWPTDDAARLGVPPATISTAVAGWPADDWIADPAFGVILLRHASRANITVRGTLLHNGQLQPLGLTDSEQRLATRIKAAMGGTA